MKRRKMNKKWDDLLSSFMRENTRKETVKGKLKIRVQNSINTLTKE